MRLSKKQLFYLLRVSGLVIFSLLLFLFIFLYFYSSISTTTSIMKKVEEIKAKTEIYRMEAAKFVAPTAEEKTFFADINKKWENTYVFPWTREEIAKKVSGFVSMVEKMAEKYGINRLEMKSDNDIIKIVLSNREKYRPLSPVKRKMNTSGDGKVVLRIEYVAEPVAGIKFAQDLISNSAPMFPVEFDIDRGRELFFTLLFELKRMEK